MRLLTGLVGISLLLVAACQTAPPTVVYIVISPTPDTNVATAEINAEATPVVTEDVPTPVPVTATPAVTSTPDPFPTPTVGEVQIAEQVFEGGRMFWIQPRQQIWVLEVTDEGRGSWTVHEDTFSEDDPASDPEIQPPGDLLQPERGFGKLWRENDAVREALGWAVTPEFGYVSRYEYHPGGRIDSSNDYIPGPGYHILFSLYEEAFRFNEIDNSWQLGRGDDEDDDEGA